MKLDYIEFGNPKIQLYRRFKLFVRALPIAFAAPTALNDATGYAFAPRLGGTSGILFPAQKDMYNLALRDGNLALSLQEVIFDYF